MIVVSCQHIKKYHGASLVLEDATVEIGHGDRVGLIGRNGSGKSTLLQLIAGDLRPDEGVISIQKGARIGYLPQIPVDEANQTVYEVLARGYRDLMVCHALMGELEARMAAPGAEGECNALLKQYAELQDRFQRDGGYEMDARIAQVANGLRIPAEQFDRPYASLSGGERTKVGLAALLIERPTLLLLDEPTNHLDAQGIEWLELFLSDYDGACLVVSHDRFFLDRVVTKVVELEDGEAQVYYRNYTGYVAEKEERLLQQFAAYKEQQKKIKQMKEAIRQLLEWGRIGSNEKFFRRAASMQRALDRMERFKRPVTERKTAGFDLQGADRSGKEVLVLEGLSKRYGDRPLIHKATGMLQYGEKVVLVGDNGAGKSTLFKLLLGDEQPDEGAIELGARVEIGYLAQHDKPDSNKTVLEAFCAEAAVESGEGRALLARYLFYGGDVFKPVGLLSGGEWTRLRLALLMHKKPNLLLLDEPTNHLDIASREALEEALEEFPGTVLAISHDRYFINRIAQRVWELHGGRLSSYLGNYDAYRERREQLALQQRGQAVGSPLGAAPAKQAAKATTHTADGERTKEGERTRGQLEQAIGRMEQQLAALDAALAKEEGAVDHAEITLRWAERERLQAELDHLYRQWLGSDA